MGREFRPIGGELQPIATQLPRVANGPRAAWDCTDLPARYPFLPDEPPRGTGAGPNAASSSAPRSGPLQHRRAPTSSGLPPGRAPHVHPGSIDCEHNGIDRRLTDVHGHVIKDILA